jgi:hypothetical protein
MTTNSTLAVVFVAASLTLPPTLATQDVYSIRRDRPYSARTLDSYRSANDAILAVLAARSQRGSTAAPAANTALSTATYDQMVTAAARFAYFDPAVAQANALGQRISAEFAKAAIDADAADAAKAAVADALAVVGRTQLAGSPRIMFSREGVLTLQWKRDDRGVALLFAGDKAASIAFKRPGQLYAENGLEAPIDEDLPKAFLDVVTDIVG